MFQYISYSTDYSSSMCEFCGEHPSTLKSEFTCNDGQYMDTFYCYSCFFGSNKHIIINQQFTLSNDSSNKCIDCNAWSVHKISGANTDLYFCDNHISPNAPCIKVLD
jgi:hypothetical protein